MLKDHLTNPAIKGNPIAIRALFVHSVVLARGISDPISGALVMGSDGGSKGETVRVSLKQEHASAVEPLKKDFAKFAAGTNFTVDIATQSP